VFAETVSSKDKEFKELKQVYSDLEKFFDQIDQRSSEMTLKKSDEQLVWPSGWVRTLFFNPTQLDGQNPKPSPRVRTPELVQGSSSDKT
jgi:hypothetical protein